MIVHRKLPKKERNSPREKRSTLNSVKRRKLWLNDHKRKKNSRVKSKHKFTISHYGQKIISDT